MTPSNRLALDGGIPTRTSPLPAAYNASGRRFDTIELDLLAKVLASGALTRWGGEMADRLEQEWAQRLNIGNSIAVASGSGALHTALAALELEPGSEIITSAISDMGTLIAILHNQLIPVFADVNPLTAMITPASIQALISQKTAAVLFVHLFGRCADLGSIRDMCNHNGIILVEDASQAHFASRGGIFAGKTGAIAAFSLQQSKVVSCGEGGMVVTDSPHLAERARLYQNKGWLRGKSGSRAYPFLGHNFRMTELQAAVARGQLSKVETLIADRASSHALLSEKLSAIDGVHTMHCDSDERPSWWAFAFRNDSLPPECRPRFLSALAAEGVPFAQGYIGTEPLFMTEMMQKRSTFGRSGLPWSLSTRRYDYNIEDFPGSVEFLRSTFVMNWNENLTATDISDIATAIFKVSAAMRL